VDVICSAVTDENESLSEKMMKLEEERRSLMNEKVSFGARRAELEISMEEVKEIDEDIFERSVLLPNEMEVLSEQIKVSESSIVVSQGEKDEEDARLGSCTVENEEMVSRIAVCLKQCRQ